MDDTLAAKLQVGDGSQGVLEQERLELQALKSEKFRTKWMERNRPWLLTHLYELIPKEVIHALDRENPSAVETLRDLQSDIVRIGQGVRKPLGGRGEISSDDDSDEEERERRRMWERQPLRGHEQHTMAITWIRSARKRLRFEKLSRGIREGALDNACSNCGRGPGNLRCRLANENGLDGLIKAFESEHGGEDSDNLELWKSFYRRNAAHYRVCDSCLDFKPRAKEVVRRMVRGVDVSSSDSSDDDGPTFSGPIQLPDEAGGVMLGWLEQARSRLLEDDGRVRVSGPNAPDDTLVASVGEVTDVGRALLISWVEHARNNHRKRNETRGAEIRNEITDVISQMSADDEWFLGSLREEGKRLEDLGQALASKNIALASQRDADVKAVRSTLTQIEADCDAELQVIDNSERKDLVDSRTQHDQDLAERHLELTRAGVGDKALEEEMARARSRGEPALLLKETEIKDRHQNSRELVKSKFARAKANAEAAVANSHSRFDTETSAAERVFRADSLQWIATAKRRLQVLESERKR